MEKLLEVLEQKSFTEAQSYIDDVVLQAENTKQEMIEEAKEKIGKRRQRYQLEADNLKRQEITRIRINENNQTNRLKQELINEVIESSKAYFDNLSPEGYYHLLNQILDQYKDQKERPRLIVCARYYAYVVEILGREYQILSSDSLESGFIFSYESYDVNFQVDQIFQYYHREMSRIVSQMMFEDEERDEK